MDIVTILLYILLLMTFYDFSLHFIELLVRKEGGRRLKYYWPTFKIKGEFNQKFRNIFWTIYWGTAFLIVIYLIKVI